MDSTQPLNWTGKLSQREIEILGLISDGLSNREISQKLYLSLDTIKWYNKQIFNKLAVSSRTQAVKVARQHRLLGSGVEIHEDRPVLMNNLPAQLTSYVGRAREIIEIKSTLKSHRLVVLTGAGGAGKTRLALQVARELVNDYRDGVWLVELAPLSKPDLVPAAIAQLLKASIGGGASLIDVLTRFLKRKQLLLLLDNFEHLLEAAPLVGELLAAAPQLTVLATSRERLHIYGEREIPVQPLELPNLRDKVSAEQLLANEAIDLFIQRARSAQPRLIIDMAQISAAARICVRLDGLPLAIELAASQVKIFPPVVLAERLTDSLDALPSGPRDLPVRQRTLRGTIEWSYNILNEVEKSLFARMGVFRGGSTLESIEYICGYDLSGMIIEPLAALVDKNLVFTRENLVSEPRFAMLETIQDYARERLAASGQIEVMRGLHAAYFADLAEQAQQEIHGARQGYWIERLQSEQDNFYSALEWSLRGHETNLGLRLVSALGHYWYYRGTSQDRRWIELALEKEDLPAHLQAGVLWAAGLIYYLIGDLHRAQEVLRPAVDAYQQLSDECNAAWVMALLSVVEMEEPGKLDSCIIMAQQSLEILRRLSDQAGMIRALTALGEMARVDGDLEAAQHYFEEAFALSVESRGRFQEAIQSSNLGFVEYRKKNYQISMRLMRHSLAILQELDSQDISTNLRGLAGPLAELGYPERAARLLGAADAQQEISGIPMQPPDQKDVAPIVETVRHALGDEDFQLAWTAGFEMTTEQAFSYALSDLPVGQV